MRNSWRREKGSLIPSQKTLIPLLFLSLLLLIIFTYPSSNSNPNQTNKILTLKTSKIQPFDCYSSPQASPIFASLVEGVKYPFFFSLSDFGSLPDKPHKNIQRILKGKRFRKPDISGTIQDLLEKKDLKYDNGLVLDIGSNVGMAAFAAAVMGYRVVAFEPVYENLQRICEGIYFNRVSDRVTVFAAAASDRIGNVKIHKVINQI
ncbi:hypothetical protein LUZ60_005509 [Juncus effusus]|nr:hypothetical protein LUZ60_005509 [Juncus effusus]